MACYSSYARRTASCAIHAAAVACALSPSVLPPCRLSRVAATPEQAGGSFVHRTVCGVSDAGNARMGGSDRRESCRDLLKQGLPGVYNVSSSDDHKCHRVVPVVGDSGVAQCYTHVKDVSSLVVPRDNHPACASPSPTQPRTHHGSSGAAASTPQVSEVSFGAPTRAEGKALYALARRTTLDQNSPYAYMMFADHFAATCTVARASDKPGSPLLGFVMGYRKPDDPRVAFVWQIGVSPDAAGQGLGTRLLQAWVRQVAADGGVSYVEATVTPGNAPSRRTFAGLGRWLRAPVVVREGYFSVADFPGGSSHDPEDLYRIGPFTLA